MNEIWTNLQTSFSQVGGMVAGMLKNLLVFLVILIIGLIIARIVKRVVKKILSMMKFDTLLDNIGVDDFFANAGVKTNISSIIGSIIYWTILLTFLVVGLDAIGIEAISAGIFERILDFVPNLIAAILVAIFGLALSKFVGKTISAYLSNAGVEKAAMLGSFAKNALFVLAAIIAIDQLGIEPSYFRIILGALGVGLALALGISFGIGGQDWAKDIVNRNLKK